MTTVLSTPVFETLEDEMNAEIREVEKAILALNLGVQAEVPLPGFAGWHLGFWKISDVWGLYVARSADDAVLLASASRAVRLAAVKEIPKLVAALRTARGQTDEEVRNAIAFLRALWISIREGRP